MKGKASFFACLLAVGFLFSNAWGQPPTTYDVYIIEYAHLADFTLKEGGKPVAEFGQFPFQVNYMVGPVKVFFGASFTQDEWTKQNLPLLDYHVVEEIAARN